MKLISGAKQGKVHVGNISLCLFTETVNIMDVKSLSTEE